MKKRYIRPTQYVRQLQVNSGLLQDQSPGLPIDKDEEHAVDKPEEMDVRVYKYDVWKEW